MDLNFWNCERKSCIKEKPNKRNLDNLNLDNQF